MELEKKKFYITSYKGIYTYKPKNINKLVEYIYIKRFIHDSKSNNVIKKMAEIYKMSKLRYPTISDSTLYSQLFFAYYVQSLVDEIEKKYGIDLTLDFSNFNELYIFLKKKGYVNKYYKEIIYQVKDYLKIIDKKLKDDKNKIDKLKIQIVEDSTRFNLKLDTKKTSYTNENFKLIKEKLEKIKTIK